MLHFVLGRVKSGKTSYIIDKIKENRDSGGIFLVPEQFSHITERELCERCGNSVSLHTEVTSFRRLAAKVKAVTGGIAANIVTGGDRILHLHSAIGDVGASLSSLAKTARRPDKLSSLLAAIDEFKAYGISPEALAKVIGDVNDSLRKKLTDLSLIYAAYEKRLGEDSFDAYDELAFVAKALSEHDFFTNRTIYLDGFSGFTAAQFDIIKSAIIKAKDVYIALTLPKEPENGAENGIFDKTLSTKARIISIAENNGVAFDEIFPDFPRSGAISHLDTALFSDETAPYGEDAPEITISSSPSLFEEAEICAAHILDKVSGGARFRDSSVAVCRDEYLPICKAVFARYGIPAYSAAPTPITSKPVISLILTALECAFRGIRTELVMEYIKTGFSGICSRSLDIFENYLYTWSPKHYEWESGKVFFKNPCGLSAPETDETRETLRVINLVRKKVCAPLLKLSSAIKKSSDGAELAEALYDFINEINLPRRCAAFSYLENAGGRFEEALEYEALLGILYEAIDSLGRLKTEKLTAEEFFSLFKILISQYELSTIPPTVDCVNISSAGRADGGHCEFRFVLGANDGFFPKNEDNSGLLSDSDRQELSDFGIELAPGLCDRVLEECRTVHSVLTSASKGIFISYLTISSQGEEMYEAQAVSRMRATFPSAKAGMTISEARQRAKIPCFDESVASGGADALWENEPHFAERLSAIKQNSKTPRGPITSRENIEAIFGKKIRLSASKADLFSSCRYAYFLRYGLRAAPRTRGEISPIEAGTLMHYVLEKVLIRLSSENTYDEKTAELYAREACRAYLAENLAGAGELSGRMSFLISEIENTVIAALRDICRELEKGCFIPSDFELGFAFDGELPPIELSGENSTVSFSGKVDRIDTYTHNDELYFRVVDYKSGAKKFSLDETVNGIGMQLLLYMFALEEMGFSRYGKAPKAAGVMYVPVSRSISETRGETPSPKKREGVILDSRDIIDAMESGEDKEYLPISFNKNGSLSKASSILTEKEFSRIKERITKILARIGDELSRGEIDPNPYTDGSFSSCKWCDFKSICAFDEERGGDCMRPLFEVKACDILNEEEEA